MTTSIRLLPVDYEGPSDREADMRSLIKKMERRGELKTAQPLLMMRARTLYVRRLQSKSRVARAVRVSINVLDRWIAQFDWDGMRKKEEFKLYQKVGNVRRRAIPNIDEKHDQLFHNLESLLEDTIFRIRRDGAQVHPRDITSLATAARICMDSRRTVHKKEAVASRHVVELQDSTLFNEFAAMLTDTVHKPQLALDVEKPEEMKQIPYKSIEDVEYESEADII